MCHVRQCKLALALLVLATGWWLQPCRASQAAAPRSGEPSDPKAHKTYQTGIEWERQGNQALAIESYRKANAQDGGHCGQCLPRAHDIALSIGDFKTAEAVLKDWLPAVNTDPARAKMCIRDRRNPVPVARSEPAAPNSQSYGAVRFPVQLSLIHI